ncbi:DUF6050 family protein [Flavonifractor sp. An82]|uniref:DUF6050 family protein n=1 Tax=Flavonifractor sp. An82 TaxID=1965660 RepID=UPI0013A60065|nr:DUF6050 family protein [Flavonifractor sp. An82]
MTRTEAVKDFFKKAVLPVAIAGLLYCIFKSACIRNGELDLLWLWIASSPGRLKVVPRTPSSVKCRIFVKPFFCA